MALQDRKQREFERREQEILDAALSLCSQPNWESVTVDQIAAKADIGKGTVYKHFASKDELLFRLMIQFHYGLLGELRRIPANPDPLVRIRSIIERGLMYYVEHPEYAYIVPYCERADFKQRAEPGWRDDFLELDRAFQEWGHPLIESGMARGVCQRRPVDDVMLGMHACFKGAVAMLWAGDDWCPRHGDAASVVPVISNFMLAALIGR